MCNGEHLRRRDGKGAMSENYWDMWKFTFCPDFKTVSFTCFMCTFNLMIWITSLIFTGLDSGESLNGKVFLGPSAKLLDKWGAKNPYQMQQNYQLWRLVTPAFLSTGFTQCFIGLFLLLLIGSMIESSGMSTTRVASLYFVGTIGGYLFGATCQDGLSVGPLPGIFALTAALFSNVIKNWKAMESLESRRFCLLIFSLGIFTIALLLTMQKGTIGYHFYSSDIYANLGGFLIGVFLSMILITPARDREASLSRSYESVVSLVGLLGSLIFFFTTAAIFFFGPRKDPYYID